MEGSPSSAALNEVRLVPGHCDITPEALRQRAEVLLRQMRERVQAEYESYQVNQPACWEEYQQNEEFWRNRAAGVNTGAVATSQGFGEGHGRLGGSHSSSGPKSAVRVSGTNNQIANVEEPDLIKSDGRYVYVALNGALRIIEALRPRVLSVTRLPGQVQNLLLLENRAVVYIKRGHDWVPPCRYGYDCEFAGDGSSTQVIVLDLTDKAAPRTVRKLELSGSLLTARRLGNAVHTVVSDSSIDPPDYDVHPKGLPNCGVKAHAVRARFERLKERNAALIRAHVKNWSPSLRENGATRSLCDTTYTTQATTASRTPESAADAYTTLVTFDLTRDAEPASTVTLRSRPGAVFASTQALYLAVARPRTRGGAARQAFSAEPRELSEVHKFRIGTDAGSARYVGSGVVPGHVLNQFSMDEWAGTLRIATSIGRVPDPHVTNSVSVLAESPEGNLVRIGALDRIAPGEDIRSVRFDGDRGYVVTFKKTDPLFVLDLQQPAQPKILGELKIPGFSTHLQRLDRDHLLSIGFDAADHGKFAYYGGLLLQLFDVADPRTPKLMYREKIGTRGSKSEAATDHLAFNYFAEAGILALPADVCEGGQDAMTGREITFSGLLLYKVSLDEGFVRLGEVDHGKAGVSCGAWWSRSSSSVKRSLILDELVYSVASDRIKVQNLKRLGEDLADLKIKP